MSDMSNAIKMTVDRHKYEISGVCACGTALGTAHGQYKKGWRTHLADEMLKTFADAHSPQIEDVDTYTLAAELVRRGFLRVELDVNQAMTDGEQSATTSDE